jgi:hypothetical protein
MLSSMLNKIKTVTIVKRDVAFWTVCSWQAGCVGTASNCLYFYSTVKPVKLATSLSRPPVAVGHTFTDSANCSCAWSLLHNFATCLCWILATVSHLVLHFKCKLIPPYAGRLQKICIVFLSFCVCTEIIIH